MDRREINTRKGDIFFFVKRKSKVPVLLMNDETKNKNWVTVGHLLSRGGVRMLPFVSIVFIWDNMCKHIISTTDATEKAFSINSKGAFSKTNSAPVYQIMFRCRF